jgi:hypothetical protein
MLEARKSELAFLVRVKQVKLFSDLPSESSTWQKADLEGLVKINIV